MLIKKKPYQFWNHRDTRKTGLPKIPKVDLTLELFTLAGRTVTGLISNCILLPLLDLPEPLLKRLKADCTLVNPEFVKAQKYGKGFVSLAIPPYVYLYSMDTHWLGLPRSVKIPYLHRRFAECGLTLELRDVRPDFPQLTWTERGDIRPLFYQEEAIQKIVEGNLILEMACGRGKTVLGTLSIPRIGYKTLILVKNNIILYQWVDTLLRVFNVNVRDIGIINGDVKREGQVTVATGQSLMNLPRDAKKRVGETYGLIITDEAHEWASAESRELLPFFKARRVIGLTATPQRDDGMTPVIKAQLGPIVKVDDLGEIDSRVHLVKTNFAYDFVGRKDKYHELIAALIANKERNQLIIDIVKGYVEKGQNILLYSCRIQHMETLRRMIREQIPGCGVGMLASLVDGHSLSVEEQNDIRESVKDHRIQLLVTGKMAEQGFDAPALGVAMLTTPTKSSRLIKQVRGRVMREYLGKKEAVLVDFIDERTKILLFQFYVKNRRVYREFYKTYD